MEAKAFQLICVPHPLSLINNVRRTLGVPSFISPSPRRAVLQRCKNEEEPELPPGLPKEYYDDKIEEAADKGELTELVLMVIWNRLDIARSDDEKEVIRSLQLLYRRVETEILKRRATPAMRLLNDLLNLHDGFDDDDEWLMKCKKRMITTFPREDPFSILVPAGFDIEKEGPIRPLPQADDLLLRVDFIREVDALLQEVRAEQSKMQNAQGFEPEAVATKLKQQEKQRATRLVETLLDVAINLQW